jgi:hypothetical protein
MEDFFFKLKAGALSYHLRRSNNLTSRTEANTTTTKTTHTNKRTQQNSAPPHPGRGVKRKPPRKAPLSPTLCRVKSRDPLQTPE